jgi:hypothetical protein
MPQTLPVEKPVCSPGEPVQRQSGKEGNDETEIKNRSQNGKAASKEAKRTTPKPSRWWLSGKSLGPRGLLPLWSQVRALWLLI